MASREDRWRCTIGRSLGVILMIVTSVSAHDSRWMKRRALFSDYDATQPPPSMEEAPLAVLLGFTLNKIDFDIIAANLKIEAWLKMKWYDERLNYSGPDFFGQSFDPERSYLPVLSVTGDDPTLWVPDVQCESAVDFLSGFHPTGAQLFSNDSYGMSENPRWNILYSRPGSFNVFCKPDLHLFPFDVQTCELRFTSWHFDEQHMQLVNDPSSWQQFGTAGHSDHLASGQYGISSLKFSETKSAYSAGTFSVTSVTISLKRMPLFFVLNAILPMFMMVVLSSLSFWIPLSAARGGSGERLSFSSTSLLTIVAIVLFTADQRPMLQETTWLDRWQTACIIFTLVPIVETIAIFWLHSIFETIQDSIVQREELSAEKDLVEQGTGTVTPPAQLENLSSDDPALELIKESSEVTLDVKTTQTERTERTERISLEAQVAVKGKDLEAVRVQHLLYVVKYFLANVGDARSVDIFFRHAYPIVTLSYLFSLYLEIDDAFGDIYAHGGGMTWPLHAIAACLLFLAIFAVIRWSGRVVRKIVVRRPSEDSRDDVDRIIVKARLDKMGTADKLDTPRLYTLARLAMDKDSSLRSRIRWQVNLDGKWCDFSADHQSMLNEAFQRELSRVRFERRGFTYEIHLDSRSPEVLPDRSVDQVNRLQRQAWYGKQVNLNTGTQRDIRGLSR